MAVDQFARLLAVDALNHAGTTNTYTKIEIEEKLGEKADASDVDQKFTLNEKQKLASLTNPIQIMGTVASVEELENIENAQIGWMYFVKTSDVSEFAEYVFAQDRKWQFVGYNDIDLTEIEQRLELCNIAVTVNKSALVNAVNLGQKNLLDVSKITTFSNHGVTVTNNGDGSLTLSGANDYTNDFILYYNINTGSTDTNSQISGHNLPFPDDYVINKDSEDNGFIIQVYSANEKTMEPTRLSSNSGKIVNFELDSDYKYIWFRLLIKNGADFGKGVIFRPMICTKSFYDTNSCFQPYAMSNVELTQRLNELMSSIK